MSALIQLSTSIIIGSLGICGNVLVLFVILTNASLRKKTMNIFIANQSVIDFIASIALITTDLIQDLYLVPPGKLADTFCRLWLSRLPLWSMFMSSTYNLFAMTFERYMAIIFPLKHSQVVNEKRVVISIILIWTIGIGYMVAYIVPTSGVVNGQCVLYSLYPSVELQRLNGIVTIVAQYFLPLLLLIVPYAHIAVRLLRKSTEDQFEDSSGRGSKIARVRKNVIKTLATINGFFIICWSCNEWYLLLFNLGYPLSFKSPFYHFTVVMVNVNCCVNPIIYSIQYEEFQKALKQIFRGDKKYRVNNIEAKTTSTTTSSQQIPPT